MLAVLLAVKKWHAYSVGKPFLICTDHQSLRFLADKQTITPYQQKLVDKMLGYDYSIAYRSGTSNVVADALSRRSHEHEGQFLQLEVSTVWSKLWDRVQESVLLDEQLQSLIQLLQRQGSSHLKFTWDGTTLRGKGKLVVGNDLVLKRELFDHFHVISAGGHSGVHATRNSLSSTLYWRGLARDVKTWVRECSVCQRCKADLAASPGLLQPLPILDKAWAAISMDFIEGLPQSKGKNTILVLIDRLAKYGHFLTLFHPYTAIHMAQEFLC